MAQPLPTTTTNTPPPPTTPTPSPLQMMLPTLRTPLPTPRQVQTPMPPQPPPTIAPMPLPRLIEKSVISFSDDNNMMKQITETHLPDGRDVDVRPLLRLVEDILNHATFTLNTGVAGQVEGVEDKTNQAGYITSLDTLSYIIDRISCELAVKALSGGDAHSTTLSIFQMLSSFSWDAKLVLTLAAFAFNYGEFWLLAQIYSTNQLAKSMAILKQLHVILEHSGSLKPRFDTLNNLIQAMLEVTRCIVELRELPSAYISSEVPELSAAMAHVPTAVYWTMRSSVACAAQITSLTSLGHEYIISTTEAWELSTLVHKLKNISEHLQKQINLCYQHIEGKRHAEAYQNLLNLFETIQIDNMKILRALIYAKDDIQPLVDGSTKRRVSIDVLRRRNVLLLISGLDISQDELSILEQIHSESKVHTTRQDIHQYEVVWIPIMDSTIKWNDPMQKKFETVQSTMPWFTVYHPSLINNVVIRFVRERWHFRNKPILVVLDPQGKVVCPNAIHMMWIWGSNAFPFTTSKEEALWRDETWRLELLIDGIDQSILNWVREGKYIFLYGGDDIEWIRKFTTAARQVALAAKIPLEMVYVGKSSKREQVRKAITTITGEKLSSTWQDLTMIWFFWTRLESMLFSKIQLGKADEQDLVMQQIKKLLSYDKAGGWAVLSKGSSMVVNGHGTTVLPALLEYDLWKEQVGLKGYDVAFKEHHDRIQDVAQPCSRFEFPSGAGTGRIPERMRCPECQGYMKKHITFLCCHEEGINPSIFE